MKKPSAYQKRIQERDKAREEVTELERLIHDHMAGKKSVYLEMNMIMLRVSTCDNISKQIWFGGTDGESEGSMMGIFPLMKKS